MVFMSRQGIYALRNNKNDKVYVGQSLNIDQRFKEHMGMLKRGNHHAYKLQRFYNQNKSLKSFEISYEVLEEVVDSTYLNARESHYIGILNSHHGGYNSMGINGERTHTKKREMQNKKFEKIGRNQKIFDNYIAKYGNSIIQTRRDYSPTFLYRVNKSIEYFIKNYNTDFYVAEIRQYKSRIDMTVYGIYREYFKMYSYSTKYRCVLMDIERQKIQYKSKYIPEYVPLGSKFNTNEKCRRKLTWFMKRLYMLDEEIIKHNTLKYVNDRYSIPFKIIRDIVGYEGKNFKAHVVDDIYLTGDRSISELARELEIEIPRGCMQINIKGDDCY